MAVKMVRDSPSVTLEELVGEFKRQLIDPVEDDDASNEDKIAKCVHILSNQQAKVPIPSVEYRKNAPCCGCQSTNMCMNWNVIRTVICCGVRKYYYIRKGSNGMITLDTKSSRKPPPSEEIQLTNAAFFLDLYNHYGAYYLHKGWQESIKYLENLAKTEGFSKDQLDYWRYWDPISTELLPPEKEQFFRDLMEDVCAVIQSARKEALKQQVQKAFTPPPVQLIRPAALRLRSAAPLSLHLEDGSSSEKSSSSESTSTPKPPIFTDQVLDSAHQAVSEVLAGHVGEDIPACHPVYPKLVQVGEVFVKFNREKIIEDILEITDATQELAEQIAIDTEEALKFPCTPKDIWQVVKRKVVSHGVHVKNFSSSPLSQKLARTMEEDFELNNTSPGIFLEMITEMRSKKQGRSPFRRTEFEIVREEDSPSPPKITQRKAIIRRTNQICVTEV